MLGAGEAVGIVLTVILIMEEDITTISVAITTEGVMLTILQEDIIH